MKREFQFTEIECNQCGKVVSNNKMNPSYGGGPFPPIGWINLNFKEETLRYTWEPISTDFCSIECLLLYYTPTYKS